MRHAFLALIMMAGPLAAQENDGPRLDPEILDVCLSTAQGNLEREACIGLAANRCQSEKGGATTWGISECLQQEADLWDARLNAAYSELMAHAQRMDTSNKAADGDASAPDDLSESLKNMQLEWIEYRDAACSYAYGRWGNGSMRSIGGGSCQLRLTARQALWLQGYLDEISQQ